MNLSKDRFDSGVSPVVGVILMVAVTVILAAVIGTFVLDLGNNVQQNPQAGVTFDQTTNAAGNYDVNVQIVSITSADYIKVTSSNSSAAFSGGENHDSDAASQELDQVGDSLTASLDAGEKLTVIGSLEGKQTVLQTYTVSDQS